MFELVLALLLFASGVKSLGGVGGNTNEEEVVAREEAAGCGMGGRAEGAPIWWPRALGVGAENPPMCGQPAWAWGSDDLPSGIHGCRDEYGRKFWAELDTVGGGMPFV